MEPTTFKKNDFPQCIIPKHDLTIEALLSLAWKKEKKERPRWLEAELSKYCQQELIPEYYSEIEYEIIVLKSKVINIGLKGAPANHE